METFRDPNIYHLLRAKDFIPEARDGPSFDRKELWMCRTRPESVEQRPWQLPSGLSDGLPSSFINGHLLFNLEDILFQTTAPSNFVSPVHSWDDIILPSREQSHVLVRHASTWTCWIHCALNSAEFEREHDDFRKENPKSTNLAKYSPSWLAIYFASLAVSLCEPDLRREE